MENVNYNRKSDASFQAWIDYCRSDNAHPNAIQLHAFIAGFNAAMAIPSIVMTPERLDFLREFRYMAGKLQCTEVWDSYDMPDMLNQFDAFLANIEDELAK